MQKVALLINPPHGGSYRSAIMRGDSLALAALGKRVGELGWQPYVADAFLRQWSVQDLCSHIPEKCDVVCFTLMHESSWQSAREVLEILRRQYGKVPALLGGTAPTLNASAYLDPSSGFDCIFSGTALGALEQDFLQRRQPEGAKHVSAGRANAYDLEPLLYRPDIEASFNADRIVCFETSQGCYARCFFCSIYSHHGQTWFPKDSNTVLGEIDAARDRLPQLSEIRFVDANFFGIPAQASDKRASAIADGLCERKIRFRAECRANDVRDPLFQYLYDRGLTGLFMGLESGNDRVLKMVRKDTTVKTNLRAKSILCDIGCAFSFGFMMITEDGTADEIWQNLEFLSQLQHGVRWKHLFSGLIYQEGTELDARQIGSEQSNQRLESRFGYYPADDLARKLTDLWNHFLMHPTFLAKEHAIGVCLERGREARLKSFWDIDLILAGAYLRRYKDLLKELQSRSFTSSELESVAMHCIDDLDPIMEDALARIRDAGLPGCVMLKDIQWIFSNEGVRSSVMAAPLP